VAATAQQRLSRARSSAARRARRTESPARQRASSDLRPAHVGCSGWNYDSWRGGIYPAGLPSRRWLERYAELFDTVEVNATFYRLLKRETAARWLTQTPRDFVFTVKASRYLTHITHLQHFERGLRRFYAGIQPLVESGKLDTVLWQLPPTQKRDDEMLREALEGLPTGRHAFEFRHESWFADEVLALLRAHDVALVIGDHPSRPWQPVELTASFSLVRLHYGARGRRGNYSDRELEEWAARIRRLGADADVLVYFNNDWEGFAIHNARRMQDLLARAS
jgi:uncharacterized protein YecE (DUF72 family)